MFKLLFSTAIATAVFCYMGGVEYVENGIDHGFRIPSIPKLADLPKLPDLPTPAPVSQFKHLEIPFYYDKTNAPAGISQARFLEAIDNANREWGNGCNITFKYMGNRSSDYSSRNNSDVGLIHWGTFEDAATLGEATQGSARGPEYEFTMTLSENSFADRRYRDQIFNLVVMHEMGHVIALDHSRNSKSIMYYQIGIGEQNAEGLNENDKAACQYYRYRWKGDSPKVASSKAGIMVDE